MPAQSVLIHILAAFIRQAPAKPKAPTKSISDQHDAARRAYRLLLPLLGNALAINAAAGTPPPDLEPHEADDGGKAALADVLRKGAAVAGARLAFLLHVLYAIVGRVPAADTAVDSDELRSLFEQLMCLSASLPLKVLQPHIERFTSAHLLPHGSGDGDALLSFALRFASLGAAPSDRERLVAVRALQLTAAYLSSLGRTDDGRRWLSSHLPGVPGPLRRALLSLLVAVQSSERAVREAAADALRRLRKLRSAVQLKTSDGTALGGAADDISCKSFFRLVGAVVEELDELCSDASYLPRLLNKSLAVPEVPDLATPNSPRADPKFPLPVREALVGFLFVGVHELPTRRSQGALLRAIEPSAIPTHAVPHTHGMLCALCAATSELEEDADALDVLKLLLASHYNAESAPYLSKLKVPAESEHELLWPLLCCLKEQADPAAPTKPEAAATLAAIDTIEPPFYLALAARQRQAVFDALVDVAAFAPAEQAAAARACMGRLRVMGSSVVSAVTKLVALVSALDPANATPTRKKKKTDAGEAPSKPLDESDELARCVAVLERVAAQADNIDDEADVPVAVVLFGLVRAVVDVHDCAPHARAALEYPVRLGLGALASLVTGDGAAPKPEATPSKSHTSSPAKRSSAKSGGGELPAGWDVAAVVDVVRKADEISTRADALALLGAVANLFPALVWSELVTAFALLVPTALSRPDNFSFNMIEITLDKVFMGARYL